MRITTKQLDPEVQSAFWSAYYAAQTLQSRDGQNPIWRHLDVWWKAYGGEVMRGLGAMVLTCGGLFGLAAVTGSPVFDWAFGAAVAGSQGLALGWMIRNWHSLAPDEFRVFVPTMELSRVERVYCECVLLLMESEATYGERSARDMIRQLNGLLATNRQLDDQRASIVAAIGRMSLDEAENERASLAHRIDAAGDEKERDALRQSLSLCESRIESSRSLQPALRRIDAQQEVILQTMLSAQSSLARLHVMPKTVSGPDLDEVTRTVTAINAQTRAVEEAVEEVLTVRSSV